MHYEKIYRSVFIYPVTTTLSLANLEVRFLCQKTKTNHLKTTKISQIFTDYSLLLSSTHPQITIGSSHIFLDQIEGAIKVSQVIYRSKFH